jgi:hypothetical protein
LRLLGLDSAAHLLVPARPDWQCFELARRVEHVSIRTDQLEDWHAAAELDDEQATIALRNGGSILIERAKARAVFTMPRWPSDEELVHPYSAPLAAVAAHWLGRESLHAGAFVHNGGAWGLVGDRRSGKSSTLAWLALHEGTILCDDVLVVDGPTAFAGPRAIDLRSETARYLDAGDPLGVVGARERWRLELDPVEPEVPLRGWIVLKWGTQFEISRVPPSQRLTALFGHRTLGVPPSRPEALIELASLPIWELKRPRRERSLADAARRLVDLVAR